MRILMISHGYPPTLSGVTLVVQKIARAMVHRGHTVTVLTASEQGPAYVGEDEGVRLVRVRSRPNPFWSAGAMPVVGASELRGVVSDTQPEVVHSHETALLSFQLLRLGLGREIPLLNTCHYLPRFSTQHLGWAGRPAELAEALIWQYAIRLMNRFDHAVFPSRSQQELFAEHGLRIPTSVISNGVDTTRYRPGRHRVDEVVTRYRLPAAPRVLFVSRLAKDKRIDVLIRAMLQAVEVGAHLLVVGTGDHRPQLEELTSELGLSQRVRFLGFVPEEDLPALYRACDLFSIASVSEIQSIPTLQAVATGLPVVAVNAAALPELVHDGTTGHVVPPNDPVALGKAVLGVLKDPERARRMGAAGLKVGRAHDEARTFDAHEALYESVTR